MFPKKSSKVLWVNKSNEIFIFQIYDCEISLEFISPEVFKTYWIKFLHLVKEMATNFYQFYFANFL